jgi:Bacterial type II/III secretion system short domain
MITHERTILRSLAGTAVAALVCFVAVAAMAEEPKAPPGKRVKPAANEVRRGTRDDGLPMVVEIFPLRYAQVGELIEMLAGMVPDVRIAADTRTNSLVAQGPEKSMAEIRSVLERLDVAVSTPRTRLKQNILLEIVWLAEGLSAKDSPYGPAAPAPADDLKPLMKQLEINWRFKNVRQVGRVSVMTLADGEFQVSCSPVFDGNPTQMTATGQATVADRDAINLKLKLSATGVQVDPRPGSPAAGEPKPKLVDLDLTVGARAGTFTVLGVAPTGKVTSIFAIVVHED